MFEESCRIDDSDSDEELHVNVTENLKTYNPKNLIQCSKTTDVKQEAEIGDVEFGSAYLENTTNITVHHDRIKSEQVDSKYWEICGSTSENAEQTGLENGKAKVEGLLGKIKTEVMDYEELDVTNASGLLDIKQESNISNDTEPDLKGFEIKFVEIKSETDKNYESFEELMIKNEFDDV